MRPVLPAKAWEVQGGRREPLLASGRSAPKVGLSLHPLTLQSHPGCRCHSPQGWLWGRGDPRKMHRKWKQSLGLPMSLLGSLRARTPQARPAWLCTVVSGLAHPGLPQPLRALYAATAAPHWGDVKRSETRVKGWHQTSVL